VILSGFLRTDLKGKRTRIEKSIKIQLMNKCYLPGECREEKMVQQWRVLRSTKPGALLAATLQPRGQKESRWP